MTRALGALLAIVLSLPLPALAQDRGTLGFGRLFTNDAIGDGKDRWHSGSYVLSMVRGPGWDGRLPGQPGALIEYRLRADIIAPADVADPAPGDRRYAGTLSIGAHTHFDWQGFETRLGFDLVGTGPGTGIGRFQRWAHDLFGLDEPDLDNQIANGVHPTVSAELGRSFSLGTAVVRPFIEAQAGVETLVRAGADVTIGRFGTGGLLIRDATTGQRYSAIAGEDAPGFSLILGGDVAHVFDSIYLPSGDTPALRDTRSRLRAGMHWQGTRASIFYGLTWLDEEFEDQPEPQVLGSLRLGLKF